MHELGKYIISVSACALACGMVLTLAKDTGHGGMIRLLCGVILTITALAPIRTIPIPEVADAAVFHEIQGRIHTQEGEDMARTAMERIIKAESEAYILDKAGALNLALEADVTVSDGIPTAVCLRGEGAPWQIRQLENIITQELGISKENLRWIGTE